MTAPDATLAVLQRAYHSAYNATQPISNQQHRDAHKAALREVAAAVIEQFAELQVATTEAHAYAMDDDDRDEHRRLVAALHNYAATWRNA
jgi:hypothetical protein